MSGNSDNEPSNFAELMGDVVRHHDDRADLHRPRKPAVDLAYRREAAQRRSEPLSDGLSDEVRQLVDSEESLIFAEPGVQLATLKKLRKGHIPWQAGLDLHGYSIDQARDELSLFVRDCTRRGDRCALVVHGKALAEDGRPPLIKSYVNDWLRQLPGVLAFVSALPKDGGTGALYVLLKRHEESPTRHGRD